MCNFIWLQQNGFDSCHSHFWSHCGYIWHILGPKIVPCSTSIDVQTIKISNWWILQLQVILYQKHTFLHQLNQNITVDCSLNYEFSTWKFQAQNMLRKCCVHKLVVFFWHSEQYRYTTCSQHVLSLEFSCIELMIPWTICRHVGGGCKIE